MGKVIMSKGQVDANAIDTLNLDNRDKQILKLLLTGENNRSIATKLKIPMSTIQRRTRNLFANEIVTNKIELNYKKLGYRTGMLHVYLKNGNITAVAKKVSEIEGMQSTTIHIGNSDIVGSFVFKQTQQLLGIMADTKKIEGVDRVVWSEEVVYVPNGEKRPIPD